MPVRPTHVERETIGIDVIGTLEPADPEGTQVQRGGR
jgi:hypothetical protein